LNVRDQETRAPGESRKTVRVFALASFLNDLGSDMIYPVWPVFVTAVLGASMSVLGLLDGLGNALVALSQAGSGYLSDRIGKRKVFVWLGYAFGASSRVGYALSSTWQQVLPFRVLDRAGKMRGAPRDAMVADASTRETRGASFGLIRAMDNLGAVAGILACLALFDLLGYRALFLLAAVPSVASALLVFALIREGGPPATSLHKSLRLSQADGNLKLFLCLSAFFSLGAFSYSFLLMYAHELGFRTGSLPVLYLIFTAVASLASLPFGRLTDAAGRKSVLLISFVLWGAVCLVLLVVPSRAGVVAAFLLYGLHLGALEPSQKTFVAELGPAETRATRLGVFQMLVGLCALPSSLMAGLIWDRAGMFAPLCVSAGLTVLSMGMLAFGAEPREPKPDGAGWPGSGVA